MFWVTFVYGDFVALQSQVISGRETGWSRSDDGDFSAGGFFWWFRRLSVCSLNPLKKKKRGIKNSGKISDIYALHNR